MSDKGALTDYQRGYRDALDGTAELEGQSTDYRNGAHDGLCWLAGI